MSMVIGVRFKRAGKVYYFDPVTFETHVGDNVVVETARGLEFGEVVSGVRDVPEAQIVAPLRSVVRMATEQDIRNAKSNEESVRNAYSVCQEKIALHKLEMKLVDVEYTFDNSKILFYFTANGRVDFRALVKDLASVFKTRIELRQIGVRDEAKMLGGLGPCGRQICCGAFLGDFQPVSIKMAKEQSLSLNPTKISGLCGRLMCCLKYEQDTYEQLRKRMPRVGKDIMTPDGIATVLEINALKEMVRVRIAKGDGSEVKEYSVDDCSKPNQDQIGAAHEHAAERTQGESGSKRENGNRENPNRDNGSRDNGSRDRQDRGPRRLSKPQEAANTKAPTSTAANNAESAPKEIVPKDDIAPKEIVPSTLESEPEAENEEFLPEIEPESVDFDSDDLLDLSAIDGTLDLDDLDK